MLKSGFKKVERHRLKVYNFLMLKLRVFSSEEYEREESKPGLNIDGDMSDVLDYLKRNPLVDDFIDDADSVHAKMRFGRSLFFVTFEKIS